MKTAAEAAAFLGVSRTRVNQFVRESPWWSAALKTADGWDVVGIAVAQAEWHAANKPAAERAADSGALERIAAAEELEAIESARCKTLERMKRERVELEHSRQLVSAEIVTSLMREMLAEIRRAFDDVAFVLSQQVSPDVLPVVFVEETLHAGDVSKMAPLQRIIAERIEQYQMWLDMISVDIFEVPDEVADDAVAE